jgi:hypothetical protein
MAAYLPASGSQAEAEIAEGAAFAAEWGDNPLEQGLKMAGMQLAAADDFLTALAVVLQSDAAWAPFGIARSVIECAARGWYLLEAEIGVRDRIARAMTERLYGLWEASHMLAPFAERAGTAGRIPAILRSADNHDFEIIPQGKRTPPAIDERRPGLLAISEALLELKQSENPGFGRMMAQYLSGMSHGVAGALSQLLEQFPDPLDLNRALGAPHLGPPTMIPFTATTLMGSLRATEREVRFYGWDWATWDSWQQNALRTCAQLIEEHPAASIKGPSDSA